MKIQFLGHNCFLISYGSKNIITDPFYNIQKEKSGFDISSQKIDYVLITHAHGDHIADVEEVLSNHSEAHIIAQPEICGYFKHQNFIDLNIGGSTTIGDLRIMMVSASHTSSFPDGTYGGVASGYILNFSDRNIYFAGDTGITADMKLLPKFFGDIDCAILPIGGHYTMDSEQASLASKKLLKTKKVIGCHFDTFPPISINHDKAKNDFLEREIELILPNVGDVLEF